MSGDEDQSMRQARHGGPSAKVFLPEALTSIGRRARFEMMRFGKPILMAILASALVLYAFDCTAPATPEQAMECCQSMACSSHGQDSQDCCKTMPTMHSPFVRASSANVTYSSNFLFAMIPAAGELPGIEWSERVVTAHSHAPPISPSTVVRPLRI